MLDNRFPTRVHDVLVGAGWYPGRRVDTKPWREELEKRAAFRMFPAADAALAEFGGLRVDQEGPGITMAREPFEIDPALAIGEDDRFGSYERVVGRRLFPLGEGSGGHYFLAISDIGEVFGLGDLMFLIGRNIDEALANLILGVRGASFS